MLVHAGIDRNRPRERLDDLVERNLFGRTSESISTACPPLGFDQTAMYQILNNFLQKLFRNPLLCGNLGYRAGPLRVLDRKINNGAQSIVDPSRNLHKAHSVTP